MSQSASFTRPSGLYFHWSDILCRESRLCAQKYLLCLAKIYSITQILLSRQFLWETFTYLLKITNEWQTIILLIGDSGLKPVSRNLPASLSMACLHRIGTYWYVFFFIVLYPRDLPTYIPIVLLGLVAWHLDSPSFTNVSKWSLWYNWINMFNFDFAPR